MFGVLIDSYSRDSAASLGRRVSLVPNISSFQHGPTSSNTYAFVWNGARDGRINGEPFEGQIELCRNGDVSVTTNGVTEVFQRVLPFPHNGFGQDAEWVAANFTNATDIAAAGGYAAWVDAQVGVRLNLVEPVVVTNIPDAYDAGYNSPTNGHWSFDQIVDIAFNTGGLECYFINSFLADGRDTAAAHNAHGIVLTASAISTTLGHEIGHAFNLEDVYVSSREKDPLAPDLATDNMMLNEAYASNDWNGGCNGRGSGGVRYYRAGASLPWTIRSMLMYGVTSELKRDITAGDVFGIWYDEDNDGNVTFGRGNATVGFFSNNGDKFNPSHR